MLIANWTRFTQPYFDAIVLSAILYQITVAHLRLFFPHLYVLLHLQPLHLVILCIAPEGLTPLAALINNDIQYIVGFDLLPNHLPAT